MHALNWVAEDRYITVYDPARALRLYLSDTEAEVWRLLDRCRLTVGELVARVCEAGVPEERARSVLEHLASAGLIYPERPLLLDEPAGSGREPSTQVGESA